MTTYYAVCDAGGPISVRLDADDRDDAYAAFRALDKRAAIDGARTDVEDDLGIKDAADLDEDEMATRLVAAGATLVHSLSQIPSGDGRYLLHVKGGWSLWAVP